MSRRTWIILIIIAIMFIMFPVSMTGLLNTIIHAITNLVHSLKGSGLH